MESIKEEKIRVAVRVRPLQDSNAQHSAITPSADGQSVLVYTDASHTSAASFRCGVCLNEDIAQDHVFESIGAPGLIEAALDGFPVTVFAYGQTGAGKSFTIFGKEDSARSNSGSVSETDGILPRAASTLMELIAARRDYIDYTVRITCVEIYNEQVRDLFDPKKQSLQIRHSKDHAFYLENATVVQCKTANEMIRVVKLAATNRTKSAHFLNDRSNRSHCLVTIYIDSMPRDETHGIKKYGKLTIVDLAGSERANDTGAVGQQLKETGHINKSLYCLSNVIQAITSNANAPVGAKNAKPKFVPYRDSKLTMLLIDSLGGNSKTLMVACVNAAPQFATESIRTLDFAMGVAKIKNRPTAMLNPHEKLISDLKEEIRLLKLENMMLRSRTPGYFTDHPEAGDGEDGDANDQALSPLGKALLSSRVDPDAYTARQYLSNTQDNNNESAFAAHATGLGGIKQLATMRRGGQMPKKSTKSGLKPPKKKTIARRPSLPTPMALPPVNRTTTPLFHRRDPQRVDADPGLVAASGLVSSQRKPRPTTPPPDYDDLFGVETVAVASIDRPNNQASEKVALSSKPSLPSLSSVHHESKTVENPGDEIQRLLRNMMNNSTLQPKPTNASTTQRPRDSMQAPKITQGHQFDDARAHDLFQQLCKL